MNSHHAYAVKNILKSNKIKTERKPHVKSFGINTLKGSVFLANRTPFCIYNYNIKKRKYQEKIKIIFILFLKNIKYYF